MSVNGKLLGVYFTGGLLLLSFCVAGEYAALDVVVPNWGRPHLHSSEASELSRIRQDVEATGRIDFSFDLPTFQRTTSAVVYGSDGVMVRTLWMKRSYEKGKHSWTWDGRDDRGQKLPNGKYTIKLGFNNVEYRWDGIIGNTESSWSSFRSWDGIVPSFVRSLAFIGSKAYSANGYNETGYAAAVFDESSPNAHVDPLTKLIFNTYQHFVFAATDGKILYFGFHTFGHIPQGVIAFYPNGDYYRFPNGSPYDSFPKSTSTFSNQAVIPTVGIPDVRVADISRSPAAAITGVAVQRNGRLLATAHGLYKLEGNSPEIVPSENRVVLSDKVTGSLIGSLTVPNPQGMAFDLNGNLWVISGYGVDDKLYRVTDVGRSNLLGVPIDGLSNPVSVSVSSKNGHLFVADGGTSQQVREFDPATGRQLSTLGVRGGYLHGNVCNASATNDTFWFDPGPILTGVGGLTSPFASWVSTADNGDLWIGDFSTSRIFHYRQTQNRWTYIGTIMYLPWEYDVSVPPLQPTRVFGGPTGFLEFKVDYSSVLDPGDPATRSGAKSWELVRNWLPCFAASEKTIASTMRMSAHSFSNGRVIGSVFSDKLGSIVYLTTLDESGVLKTKKIEPLSGWTAFDDSGSYYAPFSEPKGAVAIFSFKKYSVSDYDSGGFPIWYKLGALIGQYPVNHRWGDPLPHEQAFKYWPSSRGVIPVVESEKNMEVTDAPAFHLGGLAINGTRLSWLSMPEKAIPFTDGEGSFPRANVKNQARMGLNASAIDDNIFLFQNGNGSPWSCQFYQFKDNGVFVGQFGFQTSAAFPPTNISWKVTGYPQKGTEQPLAPGECLDVGGATTVRLHGRYYVYLGDEGYHRGIHRWSITNLESYGELSASGNLGAASSLTLTPTH